MDVNSFINELGAILSLKVSRPVQRLLKALVRSPLYLSPEARKFYLSGVKDMSSIDLLMEAKKEDANFLMTVRQAWLEKVDFNLVNAQSLLADMKSFSIYRSLLEDLQEAEDESDQEDIEIEPHWMDLADQFYRMRNEPWRKQLLINAVKDEAKNPGKINNKTIWNIAMMEEADFHDLFDFLRNAACLYIDGEFQGYMVIGYYAEVLKRAYDKSLGGKGRFEHLINRLEGEGNLTQGNGSLTINENSIIELICKTQKVTIIGNGLTDENPDISFLKQRGVDVGDEQKKSQLFGLPLNSRGLQISKYCDWTMDAQAEKECIAALNLQAKDNNLSIRVLSLPASQLE
ncbi:DUF2333 family protein [Desulfatibacillum aliphaticivorans]|uniref:DUF2333 family protein n=1 Tax=Desulfatibacillum aliphaticivorans TaxID=218208 RepID=UPI0004086349|nr:DUF2333 family protein [Desulfatibacillum aliphaticivorans]